MMKPCENAALLVIDMQKGIFSNETKVYKETALLDTINALIEQARASDTPVFFIQHCGENHLVPNTETWELHPRLKFRESDLFVHKQHVSCFKETILQAELEKRKVNRVVVCGVATHWCVKAACQEARRLGYEVLLVGDGHSSDDKEAEAVIQAWNQNLSAEGVSVIPAGEIDF